MYLYHRFSIFKRLTPSFLKFGSEKIALKPVVSTTKENAELAKQNIGKWRNKMVLLTDSQLKRVDKSSLNLAQSTHHLPTVDSTMQITRSDSTASDKSHRSDYRIEPSETQM